MSPASQVALVGPAAFVFTGEPTMGLTEPSRWRRETLLPFNIHVREPVTSTMEKGFAGDVRRLDAKLSKPDMAEFRAPRAGG